MVAEELKYVKNGKIVFLILLNGLMKTDMMKIYHLLNAH